MGILGDILGTVIGGAGGFLLGGPAGAIKGATLGLSLGGAAGSTAAGSSATQSQLQALRKQQAFLANQAKIGRGAFKPFMATSGVSPAFQLQKAFAGALGPQAQQDAFNNFANDPGTKFLRDRGVGILNNRASAIGGLGGGNRLRALTEFNQGLAANQLNNRFNQLGAITGVQANAANSFANVGTSLAGPTAATIGNQGLVSAAGTIGNRQTINDAASGLARFIPQLFHGGNPAPPSVPDFSSQLINPSFGNSTPSSNPGPVLGFKPLTFSIG